MTEIDKNIAGFCSFCKKLKLFKNTYYVYRLGFLTNKAPYTVGLLKLSQELGNWLIKKGIHLSATEVILMRPDLALVFLGEKYNTEDEEVEKYSLFESEICKDCYKSYATEIPER